MTFEEYRTQIAAYDCATYFEKYPEIDTTLEHLGRQFDQMEPAVRAHMLDSLEVAVENVPDWMKIHFSLLYGAKAGSIYHGKIVGYGACGRLQ